MVRVDIDGLGGSIVVPNADVLTPSPSASGTQEPLPYQCPHQIHTNSQDRQDVFQSFQKHQLALQPLLRRQIKGKAETTKRPAITSVSPHPRCTSPWRTSGSCRRSVSTSYSRPRMVRHRCGAALLLLLVCVMDECAMVRVGLLLHNGLAVRLCVVRGLLPLTGLCVLWGWGKGEVGSWNHVRGELVVVEPAPRTLSRCSGRSPLQHPGRAMTCAGGIREGGLDRSHFGSGRRGVWLARARAGGRRKRNDHLRLSRSCLPRCRPLCLRSRASRLFTYRPRFRYIDYRTRVRFSSFHSTRGLWSLPGVESGHCI